MRNKVKNRKIEIMDTTLRDGEQTNNLAYSPSEKLHIARILLEKVNVNRIEIASARVSKGEEESVGMITKWAKKQGSGFIKRIEILGFVDYNKSIDWILKSGAKVINLLTKGSENHLKNQLRKTQVQHFSEIEKTIAYAKKKKVDINVYLEDWSNGYLNSQRYVYDLIEHLHGLKVKRIMLPDTLGILYPRQVFDALSDISQRFSKQHFDFHPQNDYGLGTVNVLEALRGGALGVHTTVNCLGERAGNAALAEVVAGVHDHLKLKTQVIEKNLLLVSKVVETFSGKRMASHTPIVGEDVFTHTAGIHADGNRKGGLYDSKLLPKRFGRKREYALGKLAGKASLDIHLEKLGIELSEKNRNQVLARIIEMGDQKKTVTESDIPFIVADVLKLPTKQKIKFGNVIMTSATNAMAVCSVILTYNKKQYKLGSTGDGGYDAFMRAIRPWCETHKIKIPKLRDYEIRIPPGGKTSAMVECKIIWSHNGNQIITIGLDHDQVMAAVHATEKMLNIILD